MRKHISFLSAGLLASMLILPGCNSGYNITTPTPQPLYNFTGFTSTVTGPCNTFTSPYTCSAESSTIAMSASYVTATPPAALLPLTQSLPTGVTMTSSSGCTNMTGANYSCTITLVASGAESNTVSIPFNGSNGPQAMYNIIFQ